MHNGFEDPYEGQKFTSFEVLKKYLEEYGRRNFVKFWIRSSHTINSLKSKVAKKMNPELKYVCMKFACIFGGEKIRCRGSGIRKSTTYRNLGCPCIINAVVGDDGNHVKLDTVVLEHNHALCKTLYDSLKKTKKKLQTIENNKIKSENSNLKHVDVNSLDENKDVFLMSKCKEELPGENFTNGCSDFESEVAAVEEQNEGNYLRNIQEKYGSNVKIIVVDSANKPSVNVQEVKPEPEIADSNLNSAPEPDETVEPLIINENDICRLCLSSTENLSPIFNANLPLESTILSFKIMGCASIEVNSDDGLPGNICSTCEATLDIAYNFRIRCEKSDSILRKVIQSSPQFVNTNTENDHPERPEEEISIMSNDEINAELEELTCELISEGDNGVFEAEANLKNMTDFTESKKPEAFCPVCNSKCETYFDMLKHLTDHTGDDSTLLTCNLCNVICVSINGLYEHMVEHVAEFDEQMTDELNSCAQCNLSFLTAEELKIHQETHNVKNNVSINESKLTTSCSYLCNVCGKILRTKDRFQSHKNTHEGLRPHVCLKCGKAFADRKNMHQHFDIVHLRKAKHECPICQKKFYTPTKMKSHITMHYGVKPFSCDVCNKTFRLKMNMMKHKKTHTNDRRHQCDKCNAAFIDKNMLRRHSYIHGGVRPFPCPICGHRFSVKFHLKKHLERNKCHGNGEYSMNEWVNLIGGEGDLAASECVIVYETEDNILNEAENEPITMDILQEYDPKEVVHCIPEV